MIAFDSFWAANFETQTFEAKEIISVILVTHVLFAPVLPLQTNTFTVLDTRPHLGNMSKSHYVTDLNAIRKNGFRQKLFCLCFINKSHCV